MRVNNTKITIGQFFRLSPDLSRGTSVESDAPHAAGERGRKTAVQVAGPRSLRSQGVDGGAANGRLDSLGARLDGNGLMGPSLRRRLRSCITGYELILAYLLGCISTILATIAAGAWR